MKIASLCDVYEVNCAPHNFYGNLCSVISATFSACIPNFRVMEIDIDSVAWRDEIHAAAGDREWRAGHADRAGLGRRGERGRDPRAAAEVVVR